MRDMEECLVNSGLFSHDPSKTNPGVVMMESSLLDIGSNPEVSQGIFYMLPFEHERKLFVRFCGL